MTVRGTVRAAEDRARRRDPNPISSSKEYGSPNRGSRILANGIRSATNFALCSGMPFVRGSVSRGNAFAVVKREAVAGGVNDSPVVASRHGGNQ